MVKCSIDEVHAGMTVAEPAFVAQHKMLLAARVRLSYASINSLKNKGIKSLFIEVKGAEDTAARKQKWSTPVKAVSR
ncbi:MAG: hypothetical protein GF398_15490 [Chitinivibrionales bacterium]|nr:hypothetical protein [Chitinivibrionales bacterium]